MSGLLAPLKGRAFLFGDNVDTDIIIPARYLNTIDPRELAAHCMEPVRPGFAREVPSSGGIIVAGENFGCGSSREHAPMALAASGIVCVAAESLARIFYRNAINRGLPAVICPGASSHVSEGDVLEMDLAEGVLLNCSSGASLRFEPLPPFMREILEEGGLMPYLKKRSLSFP